MSKKALVVIDIQREYITPGRPFHIASIGPSLKNAHDLLLHARSAGWPIAHVRHLQDGSIFNPTSEFSEFVEEFMPIADEQVCIKGNFSSFTSPEFEQFALAQKDCEMIVVGYGTSMCCLSTIIDGYHRGYKFALVQDATAAIKNGELSEESVHQHEVATLSRFSRITTAQAEMAAAA